MNIISASHMQSSYGRKQVLTDVDLEVEKGCCTGIVGANGSGKSTLLAILAGIRRPDGGILSYDPEDGAGMRQVSGRRERKSYGRIVGYVPQESILLSEMTVWDNLLLWYADRKILLRELDEGFLGELGLKEVLRQKAGQLSGGMQKRLGIGIALAHHPRVLILDEPGAALDLPGKADMWNYLEHFKKKGGTIVLTTHDEKELELCDRLYVLKNGCCEQIDQALRGTELSGRL